LYSLHKTLVLKHTNWPKNISLRLCRYYVPLTQFQTKSKYKENQTNYNILPHKHQNRSGNIQPSQIYLISLYLNWSLLFLRYSGKVFLYFSSFFSFTLQILLFCRFLWFPNLSVSAAPMLRQFIKPLTLRWPRSDVTLVYKARKGKTSA